MKVEIRMKADTKEGVILSIKGEKKEIRLVVDPSLIPKNATTSTLTELIRFGMASLGALETAQSQSTKRKNYRTLVSKEKVREVEKIAKKLKIFSVPQITKMVDFSETTVRRSVTVLLEKGKIRFAKAEKNTKFYVYVGH